jgi:uncharacterized OB-fold protein
MADLNAVAVLEGTEPFVEGCRRGELVLLRCDNCGFTILPNVALCERCGSCAWTPFASTGRGAVYSYTAVHRPPEERFAARVPYVIVLVDLDDGPRIMGVLDDVDANHGLVGVRVSVRFRADELLRTPYFVQDRS